MCQHQVNELGKTIMASGEYHLWYRCAACHQNVTHPGPYVSKKTVGNIDFDDLPVFVDYRPNNPPCERCGAIGTELHHWSPKEFFQDADDWPKSYLCKKCHDQWHAIMTTPFRALRRKEQNVNAT